jgi:hypothetical protein
MKDADTRPLKFGEWRKHFREERAKRVRDPFEIVLASVHLDAATARSVRVKRRRRRVDVVAKARSFAPRIITPKVRTVDARRARRQVEFREPQGFRPAHLDFRALPKKLPAALRQDNRIRRVGQVSRRGMGLPTSIFSPDDRYTFSDTAFPWSTCGRVDTAAGWGSGVMIGPRHMMTASHVVNWGPNNTAGWLKFTPLLFDTTEPFGHAYATTTYWWLKADPSDQIQPMRPHSTTWCGARSAPRGHDGWMGSRATPPTGTVGATGDTSAIQTTLRAASVRRSSATAPTPRSRARWVGAIRSASSIASM